VPFGIIDSILGNKAEKKAANRQHEYNLKSWEYQFKEANRDFDFQVQGNQIARQNIENNSIYQEQTALRQYQNELAIRNFDYGNQVRQFNESERIYGLQLGFNSQASQVAYEAENRRFQETLTGMAFEQQDMLVKMLQEEGQVQASGVSGRSSGKALASAMASYGRNQAIMAESLVSAKKENKVSMRQIDTEKYGADLAAQSRRMLVPMKAPAPMVPLKMPRAILQDPRKPVKPPKPIRGATGSMGAAVARGAASDIGMALSIASMFSDVRLKENVVHVGTAPSGISIYEWNYKWSKQRYRGAIAQDVLNYKPEAVVTMEPGFLGVKYGLIDVSMEPIA
jgi:hypothetical protein